MTGHTVKVNDTWTYCSVKSMTGHTADLPKDRAVLGALAAPNPPSVKPGAVVAPKVKEGLAARAVEAGVLVKPPKLKKGDGEKPDSKSPVRK